MTENIFYYYLKIDKDGNLRSVSIDKMRNCPFCNSDRLINRNQGKGILIKCIGCGAEGPKALVLMAAETLWNTRNGDR